MHLTIARVHRQSPQEILTQLRAGINRGNVAELNLPTYLNADSISAIWRDNQVDAAFIGTKTLGTENALYLFRGDEYLRFTPDNGIFGSTADSGYPKKLSTNREGLPRWSQMDAAFTSPNPDANGNNVSYLFNNKNQQYYRSDTSKIETTVDVWGMVSLTNLQSTQRVNAAYVSGNHLYLIASTEYYRYTLESSANNDILDTIPRYIDKGYPQRYTNVSENINAAFTLNKNVYLFSGTNYHHFETEYGLELISLKNRNALPTARTGVVTVAKIDNAYHVRIFDNTGNQVLDKDSSGFVPDGELSQLLTNAFSSKSVDNQTKNAILQKTAASLGYTLPGPTQISQATPITGSWGNIPTAIRSSGLDAAFKQVDNSNKETLYLIKGSKNISYELSNPKAAHPYEINAVNYEVIRLTSSTAEQLNQILFAKGIDALLSISTQEIDESPTISLFEASTPKNIKMNEAKFKTEPTNSHLDFNSANGIYYWEVFFHAPFLIAQTLNADQKFEAAKQWYEYIFDPTEISDYWKFLPFLATDPAALIATLTNDLNAFEALTNAAEVRAARSALAALDTMLAGYQTVFLGQEDLKTYEATHKTELAKIKTWPQVSALADAINALKKTSVNNSSNPTLLVTWKSEMQEVVEVIKTLNIRLDLMSNFRAQLTTYLDDPFDPHAIAALRPLAYRKAIVMRYIDNLLDWGDMLFRQYTRESINEARMLYILAYDLLGEKPKNMGRVVLESTKSYSNLQKESDSFSTDYDFLVSIENSIDLDKDGVVDAFRGDTADGLSFAATQFDSVINPYFYLKENDLFTKYWTRVEDRLGKIRACLNIDGVAQPLPLFQPPIDPMALVSAVAGGGGVAAAAAMAAGAATVPAYRFSSLMAKARELVTKLNGFSDALLSVLEKADAEELSLLQSQQEAVILELTTFLKKERIKEAKQSKQNLLETQKSAQAQLNHYTRLIAEGYLPSEQTQIDLMTAGAAMHTAVVLSKIISGLSYVIPQVTIGAFSFGVTTGGRNYGAMLSEFGGALESSGEALSMFGEVAGVVAQYQRSKQDWELQQQMASSEITQINYQLAAQDHSIAIAEQELLIHEKEMENHESIATFMKSKFSNKDLYSWMSGKISGLFYQTYKLAHDYAKQAEQAFIFERGLEAGQVNYINGMYWDSQRKGLLSGNSLGHDLDRLEKAYRETNSRRLEITKNISLLELDPMALLSLKTNGFCQFRLSEELFDYDFPGHYNRQIKTISLAFDAGEGQQVNATLTQLSSKLVMGADIKAVKHLIDPSNEATPNVRVNWRANQQVALSHVDQYTENNGMFELNFGDERYLPFEGTGAVSNWRLELNGIKGSYNPADLLDVTIKLRYTAKQGGSRLANEVRGVLKPYHATSFFDMAYNFSNQWAALTEGDVDEVEITFTRDMFPNMSSSKIIGLFMRYEYADEQGGAIFTINDDLQVPNNTYLQPHTLNVGQNGSSWTFMLKGDGSTLKNAEMVLVYKAKV